MSEEKPESELAKVVKNIQYRICNEYFSTGALAALKRVDPKNPLTATAPLHRLLAEYVPEARLEDEKLASWVLLVHLLGLAAPNGFAQTPSLGKALFEADYKEGRLTRLLKSRPEDFPVVLPRMVRFLRAKGQTVKAEQLASFVLFHKEADYLAIARDYYRAEAKSNKDAA